ncbi:MAG: hypothetical protein KBO59_22515 [Achromobacter sp.]|nr:hypothetical protein [Achromobacter sp.]
MKTIIDTSIRVGIATIMRRKMSLSMWKNRRKQKATRAGPAGAAANRRAPIYFCAPATWTCSSA